MLGFIITIILGRWTNGNIFKIIAQIIFLGKIALPVLVSLEGIILGIGSIFLKEATIIKSIIPIALNIAYVILYFSYWSM